MENSNSSTEYSADTPLESPEEDRFNRWPFAQRVAQVLSTRRVKSSLVVGLYGSWGEGKTTTLNYIENALQNDSSVVVVRFNPWRFGDETVLIRQFFDTIAKAIGGKLTNKREDFASEIKKYSSAISFGAFGARLDPSKIAEAFSEIDLEELRSRLEAIIQDAGLRVVIRMDDIDRLNIHEIRAVFRLVKLSADFKNVAYVLAFDPDVVAAALQEQFSSSRGRAGYDFLEKIITVPLQLPPARPQAILEMCIEIVNEAFQVAGVDLADGGNRFVRSFHSSILPAIKTPRMAKRYGNAVLFALPILAGEVNTTDQLLIEGMRVAYPLLYQHVRTHPSTYLRNDLNDQFRFLNHEDKRSRHGEEIDKVIAETASEHIISATSLIDDLFPKARGQGSNSGFPRRERRIAADWYFDRYFTYAVPSDSVADKEFAELITFAENQNLELCIEKIRSLVSQHPQAPFAEMLNLHADTIALNAVSILSRALAGASDVFSQDRNFLSLSPQDYVASAVKQMIARVVDLQEREDLAKIIVSEANKIEFALNFVSWASPKPDEGGKSLLTEEGCKILMSIIADRVAEKAKTEPLHIAEPRNASWFYHAWSQGRSRDEVENYISNRLSNEPAEVVSLLSAQQPKHISSNEDGVHPGNYTRDTYDFVCGYVDPELIAAALKKVYSLDILEAGYVNMQHVRMGIDNLADVSIEEATARQFMAIHQAAKNEEKQKGEKANEKGNTDTPA